MFCEVDPGYRRCVDDLDLGVVAVLVDPAEDENLSRYVHNLFYLFI